MSNNSYRSGCTGYSGSSYSDDTRGSYVPPNGKHNGAVTRDIDPNARFAAHVLQGPFSGLINKKSSRHSSSSHRDHGNSHRSHGSSSSRSSTSSRYTSSSTRSQQQQQAQYQQQQFQQPQFQQQKPRYPGPQPGYRPAGGPGYGPGHGPGYGPGVQQQQPDLYGRGQQQGNNVFVDE